MHLQKVKVKNDSVKKLDMKQINGRLHYLRC